MPFLSISKKILIMKLIEVISRKKNTCQKMMNEMEISTTLSPPPASRLKLSPLHCPTVTTPPLSLPPPAHVCTHNYRGSQLPRHSHTGNMYNHSTSRPTNTDLYPDVYKYKNLSIYPDVYLQSRPSPDEKKLNFCKNLYLYFCTIYLLISYRPSPSPQHLHNYTDFFS